MEILSYLAPVGAFGGIVYAVILSLSILKKDQGTDRMIEISQHIREGASAYLNKQYIIVSIFFAVVFVLLILKSQFIDKDANIFLIPLSFLSGGLFSAMAGFFGMKIATNSNNRTAWAAKSSLNEGLRVAFNSGTVMGMLVVGLGLLHLSLWYFLLGSRSADTATKMTEITNILVSSGLGASSMALFARVGGGIFTKAADVGADLVGKVEAGIPEDDPRNPATIADNVGDNVGDVAGMGADLY
ncbi:MAG: sodium/proton-translocating pyrophosphatase, partial [Spirochaetota bacterium]|nr:sodium/proton-translocating pyrophosphatase [Spirochaetota bacterium]